MSEKTCPLCGATGDVRAMVANHALNGDDRAIMLCGYTQISIQEDENGNAIREECAPCGRALETVNKLRQQRDDLLKTAKEMADWLDGYGVTGRIMDRANAVIALCDKEG